jgi:hypothetical protein
MCRSVLIVRLSTIPHTDWQIEIDRRIEEAARHGKVHMV